MTKDYTKYTIDDLVEKAKVYIPEEENIEKIKRAYDYAALKHQGQYRKSGEAYIYHPLCTAIILTTVYADTVALPEAERIWISSSPLPPFR